MLRGIDSNTIDLIATDPPFNKNKDFHADPDSLSRGASFQDRWSWNEIEDEWTDKLKDDFPDVYHVVQGSRKSYGDDMGAFLCFMAVRLLEMQRILKDTGTIYLHCDPTASHYLKELMDAIFGRKNFRNEIVWCYTGPRRAANDFPRQHDIILRYVKGGEWTFNEDKVRIPHKRQTLSAGRGMASGNRTLAEVQALEVEQIKKGKICPSWWDDIGSGSHMPKNERTGYPTQKPVKLYKRMIEASSNEGDIVLDPFCGCATTLIAAEQLDRRWVGIDLWKKAHRVVWKRLREECWLEDPEGKKEGLGILKADAVINYQAAPPERTDDGEEAVPFMQDKKKYHEPKEERKSRNQIFKELVGQNRTEKGIKCVGCNRFFDDDLYLQLDHNIPRSQGGINHISNRMLLCGPCNFIKGDKYTLKGLQAENKKRRRML